MQYKGVIASSGIVIGPAFVLDQEDHQVKRRIISEGEIEDEIRRFEHALEHTKKDLLNMKEKMEIRLGSKHTKIFDAYLLILEDPMFLEETILKVRKNHFGIEYAFTQVLDKFVQVLTSMEDEYWKERGKDIENLGIRVLRSLIGEERKCLANLTNPVIVIAGDLSPSDTMAMREENVLGFATDHGGKTSHTTIIAQSLEIPAVVAFKDITSKVSTGDLIILDGIQGLVITNPDKATLRNYVKLQQKFFEQQRELDKLESLPAETVDRCRVKLMANIEVPEKINLVLKHGVDGIGLYRTEFFFINKSTFPNEDVQLKAYRSVAKSLYPKPVTIRTIDLGGDKFLPHIGTSREVNPFMGLRAIRLCLKHQDIFRTQLRAILRASTSGNVNIMYPMISSIEEVYRANQILKDVMEDLKEEGIPFNNNIKVGIMIEIPSAAMTADVLAKEVDFLSIGTNDLIQYTLAVDRVNENVAYLYEPLHPSVLRLIKYVIDAGHKHGKLVGVCGEMAVDPMAVLILLGMGLDEFSMGSSAVPKIKKLIRSVTMKEVEELARKVLNQSTASAIKRIITHTMDSSRGLYDKLR